MIVHFVQRKSYFVEVQGLSPHAMQDRLHGHMYTQLFRSSVQSHSSSISLLCYCWLQFNKGGRGVFSSSGLGHYIRGQNGFVLLIHCSSHYKMQQRVADQCPNQWTFMKPFQSRTQDFASYGKNLVLNLNESIV